MTVVTIFRFVGSCKYNDSVNDRGLMESCKEQLISPEPLTLSITDDRATGVAFPGYINNNMHFKRLTALL